ncbi:MAG: CBS domain-containing protein [Actinobacteria bacterium]|nr:CBS domain-containing protein [Actinomycetota bacterium]
MHRDDGRRSGTDERTGVGGVVHNFDVEEVSHIVEESHREGLVEAEKYGLVGAAPQFSDKDAADVGVRLTELVTVPVGATPDDIERLVAKHGFSRYPTVNPSGELTGYLHLKDVLYADDTERQEPVPSKRIRRLATVRRDDEVEDVLATMQRTGAHVARASATRVASSASSSSRTLSRSLWAR